MHICLLSTCNNLQQIGGRGVGFYEGCSSITGKELKFSLYSRSWEFFNSQWKSGFGLWWGVTSTLVEWILLLLTHQESHVEKVRGESKTLRWVVEIHIREKSRKEMNKHISVRSFNLFTFLAASTYTYSLFIWVFKKCRLVKLYTGKHCH